jgi:alkylation response protein AidB-like acyl-CoA dehydrogenase
VAKPGLGSYAAAQALETALGDPLVDANPLSFRSTVAFDEREERPQLAALDQAGLHRHYVPIELGGALHSYESLFWLLRCVGRRDFTAATTHAVSFPGAALVWHAGTPAQKASVAQAILGGKQLSIAYHEKEHGNDFMATEVVAEDLGDGYALSGEKWVVANARRSELLVVLARTNPQGGPRGFSLILVDKRLAEGRSINYLDRFKTHGVRGQDIDGIRFEGLRVPREALLGASGAGFELSLKCSQISRTLSLGPLLGALDTALRASLAYLVRRRLYGARAFEIPAVRAALVDAFLDILLAECATLASTRAIHFAPGRLAVWAPAAKAFATATAEGVLYDLSVLMGSRFYLRDTWWHGIFQKIVRDAPMTRVSHFGGIVSLVHLGSVLHSVYQRSAAPGELDLEAAFGRLFDVAVPAPAADAAELRLVPHGVDELVLGLRFAAERLAGGALASQTEPVILLGIRRELELLLAETDALRAFLAGLPEKYGPGFGRAPEMLSASRRHAALFAATAATLFWLTSRASLDDFGKAGAWLHLALRRVREQLRPTLELRPAEADASVSERLEVLLESELCFSLLAAPLARRGSPAIQAGPGC